MFDWSFTNFFDTAGDHARLATGLREPANRSILLLLVALVSVSCTGSSKNDSDSRFAGAYVWGHEVHTFTPCGGQETYWVDATEETASALRKHYEATATEPYQALHFEFKGHFLNETPDGFAADYDGLIIVDEVLEWNRTSPASCGPDAVSEAVPTRRCYRNVQPFVDDPGNEDVLSLTVEVGENGATGDYNWLPAFKDQRLGTFDGEIDGPVISASYEYIQEGQSQVAQILIRLEPGQAIVEGGSPELGLTATIEQVDCPSGDAVSPASQNTAIYPSSSESTNL